MREIKFRAWSIERQCWVYFTALGTPDWVSPYEIEQYIGLHDKMGNEIYEGDILEENKGYYFQVVYDVEWARFKLQWRTKAIQFPEWNRGNQMTVVGNIYENPELLNG